MTTAQQTLDDIRATAWQRWVLIAISLSAPLLGCAAVGAASGRSATAVSLVIVLIAIASACLPDSHIGAAVIAVVVWFWLARIDDVTTPWSLAVAAAVLVFHVVTALMAVTSRIGGLGADLTLLWLRRTAVVAVAMGAMWAIVLVMDRRRVPGSVAFTLAALLAMAAATLVLRASSTTRNKAGTSD